MESAITSKLYFRLDDLSKFCVFSRLKGEPQCENVQNVVQKKKNQNSGNHVLIASFAKKKIGEIGLTTIKKHMPKEEKNFTLKIMGEPVSFATCSLSEKRENIAARFVFSKTILSEKRQVVGNGKDFSIMQNTDISQILKLQNAHLLTDILIQSIKGKLQIDFMYVIIAIILNAVTLTTFSWELIKKTCRIAKIKEEQQEEIKLLEKVKIMRIQFLPMRLCWIFETYVQKVLKTEKFQRFTNVLYTKLMPLDIGGHGNISSEVNLGRI